MIRDSVRAIVAAEVAPHATEWDEKEAFPAAAVKAFGEAGLFGTFIPEEYGGNGAGALATVVVIEEIAKVCGATATTYGAQPLGCYPILLAGSEEQKHRYLPKAASGEWLAAFALSEAESGSDAGGARTTAVRKGDRYVVNGTKTWITSGHVADFLILYVKTDPAEGTRGLSALILEKGMKGFSIGKHEKKMGVRASATVRLVLEDVEIPVENLIGAEGQGFPIAMRTLDRGRPTVAAIALGLASGALDYATEYAEQRRQFGKAIASFQGVQFMLADMRTKVHAARLMVYETASLIDAGVKKYTTSPRCQSSTPPTWRWSHDRRRATPRRLRVQSRVPGGTRHA